MGWPRRKQHREPRAPARRERGRGSHCASRRGFRDKRATMARRPVQPALLHARAWRVLGADRALPARPPPRPATAGSELARGPRGPADAPGRDSVLFVSSRRQRKDSGSAIPIVSTAGMGACSSSSSSSPLTTERAPKRPGNSTASTELACTKLRRSILQGLRPSPHYRKSRRGECFDATKDSPVRG